MTRFAMLLAILVSVAAPSFADPGEHPMPKISMPKEFDALKKLAGDWEGKTKMGDKEMPVAIHYEVTAGGSAILERMFSGTPHEMISVYTAEGGKVTMTHYCMLGNHPTMTLTKAEPKTLAFEMKGTDGLHSAKDPHMHALTISFTDANHIR